MSAVATSLRTQCLVAFSIALGLSIIGGLLTDVGSWYIALHKPSWQPPNWLFGPVWTFIYACSASAGVLAWRAAERRSQQIAAGSLWAINVLLNAGWSLLFFKLRRPDHALMEVGLLWLSVLALLVYCGALSRTAGVLLIPYLAWLSFASFLNLTIVQLNPVS